MHGKHHQPRRPVLRAAQVQDARVLLGVDARHRSRGVDPADERLLGGGDTGVRGRHGDAVVGAPGGGTAAAAAAVVPTGGGRGEHGAQRPEHLTLDLDVGARVAVSDAVDVEVGLRVEAAQAAQEGAAEARCLCWRGSQGGGVGASVVGALVGCGCASGDDFDDAVGLVCVVVVSAAVVLVVGGWWSWFGVLLGNGLLLAQRLGGYGLGMACWLSPAWYGVECGPCYVEDYKMEIGT